MNDILPNKNENTGDGSKWRSLLTQFSSVLALGISFFALAIGAYQTRLMQNQARASVWPFISIGYSYFDQGENAGFTWQIYNNGVGPARIESVKLSLDGKPIRRWDEVFESLFTHGEARATIVGISGNVLPPNTNRETTIAAIKIVTPELAKGFLEARDRFTMEICYCSVYDECWIARWQQHKVEAVDRCDAGGIQFEQ